MLFLGISIESQRTRAVVFSLESNAIVAEGVSNHAGEDGVWLPDPTLWVRAVNESVQQCLGELGAPRERVAGVSVCGPSRGIVLLDQQNRLLLPGKRYEKEAAAREARALGRRFGGRPGVLELLGRPLAADATAPYLAWLKREEPEIFGQVASVLRPHEFLNFWLTGVKRGDYSGGADTGLMDVRHRSWCAGVMEEIDERIPDWVPDLHPSEEVAGGLRPAVAKVWGLADHLMVAAGGSRVAMEALGAGVINPGEVLVRLTEESALRVVTDRPAVDPLGELVLGCDATGGWMLSLGRCQNAALVEEVKDQWGWDNGQFERVASGVAPGAGGLDYLAGGRRSILHGLQAGNLTSPNLARAAMEAAAYEVGRALDSVEKLGLSLTRVKLVGGSGESTGWRQVLADVLGRAVGSVSANSSPAVGAALQAAVVFYHSSGENITATEVAEYALAIGEHEWSYPEDGVREKYRELAAEHGRREEQSWGESVCARNDR